MWDQDHGLLPNCLASYFKPVNEIHGYNTRMASSGKLSEDIVIRTDTHGKQLFKFIGTRILNKLKDLTIYKNSKSKKLL